MRPFDPGTAPPYPGRRRPASCVRRRGRDLCHPLRPMETDRPCPVHDLAGADPERCRALRDRHPAAGRGGPRAALVATRGAAGRRRLLLPGRPLRLRPLRPAARPASALPAPARASPSGELVFLGGDSIRRKALDPAPGGVHAGCLERPDPSGEAVKNPTAKTYKEGVHETAETTHECPVADRTAASRAAQPAAGSPATLRMTWYEERPEEWPSDQVTWIA